MMPEPGHNESFRLLPMDSIRIALLAGLFTASNALPSASAPTASQCLPSGNGYLSARIRGALNLDIDWRNSQLECEGGARPDGKGLRLSFAGPVHSDGRRLRLVFGIASATEGAAAQALPTNLTVMFEGEQRLFATRGEDRCTVDDLRQERIGALDDKARLWRVIARGFCVAPANALSGEERILVTRFDFAGRVTFEPAAAPPTPVTTPSASNPTPAHAESPTP